jgi:hypothetical protein
MKVDRLKTDPDSLYPSFKPEINKVDKIHKNTKIQPTLSGILERKEKILQMKKKRGVSKSFCEFIDQQYKWQKNCEQKNKRIGEEIAEKSFEEVTFKPKINKNASNIIKVKF